MGKNLDMKTNLSGINITNSRTLLNMKYSKMNSGMGDIIYSQFRTQMKVCSFHLCGIFTINEYLRKDDPFQGFCGNHIHIQEIISPFHSKMTIPVILKVHLFLHVCYPIGW